MRRAGRQGHSARSTMAGMVCMLLTTGCGSERQPESQVERGRYLVQVGGCVDCHTPGYFRGSPDPGRRLGGSDVGLSVAGLGVFVGPNLTPDATGLGAWSQADIVKALRTGERPDGRMLAPIMPWPSLARLDTPDLEAIAAYLKSLPPVRHQVRGPFAADQPVPIPSMQLVPPGGRVVPPGKH